MPTLFLSRLTLNPLRREVQRDIADCHNMHRRLLSAFPDLPDITQAREHYGVLYRIEQAHDRTTVLAQSRHTPDWTRLPEGYLLSAPEVKSLDSLYERLRPGMELTFRLYANPTRRISHRNTEQAEKWRGKRVNLSRESDQLDWLRRKGETAGFTLITIRARPSGLPDMRPTPASIPTTTSQRIPDARAVPSGAVAGRRRGSGALTFGAVTFEGRLSITDLARFRAALEQGVGSGKAYGFGLLSIAPISPSLA